MPVGVASRLGGVPFADFARNVLRLRIVLLLGLLAVASLVNVRLASASCGDYVVIGNPSANGASHDAAGTLVSKTAQHAEHIPLAPTPCHGPSCRRVPHPFAVPNAPPPSLERSPDCWAKFSDEACDQDTAAFRPRGEFDAPSLSAGWYPATWRPPEAI